MSYSRWSESNWYIFPSVEKRIEVWRAGETTLLNWLPTETYAAFLEKAANTLTHDEDYEEDFAEMKEILEEDYVKADIAHWFELWNSGKDSPDFEN